MLTVFGIIFALLSGTLIGMILTEKSENSEYDEFDEMDKDDYWM